MKYEADQYVKINDLPMTNSITRSGKGKTAVLELLLQMFWKINHLDPDLLFLEYLLEAFFIISPP